MLLVSASVLSVDFAVKTSAKSSNYFSFYFVLFQSVSLWVCTEWNHASKFGVIAAAEIHDSLYSTSSTTVGTQRQGNADILVSMIYLSYNVAHLLSICHLQGSKEGTSKSALNSLDLYVSNTTFTLGQKSSSTSIRSSSISVL